MFGEGPLILSGMTIEQVKEQLSIHYVGTMAGLKGYRVGRPHEDYGVDIILERIQVYEVGGKKRYFSSGQSIDIQLKATTKSQLATETDLIKYDLRVQNYNDLVNRRLAREKYQTSYISLLLILFVLPDDPKKWVKVKANGNLLLRGSAYWFYPSETMPLSSNKYTQRIHIPKANQIDLNFFDELFNLLYR
ncbi:MAG: DUF4365 domain-containing protein [Phaeodactylibacter sp.]|nr:DUF4365 domain-containing protein [Phaeodactylibacter sp.]